jgi:Lrp/AsnC family transcriptional regulator for asnA, asnC and gidA
MGFDSSAIVGTRVSGSPMDVAGELAAWTEAGYVVVTAGRFDVVVELICSDARTLQPAERAR